MRFFDLMTLDNIRTVNSFETTNEYYKYLDTAFRSQELNDISNLVKKLNEYSQEVNTDGFCLGFKIPQISKEFDLLRFSKDLILNIELKSKNKPELEIKKQLVQNLYYLKGFNYEAKEIHLYTYMSENNCLYHLIKNSNNVNELTKNDWNSLIRDLSNNSEKVNLSNVCTANKFLVSPFNNTDKFLNSEYFLTDQQRDFKKTILDNYEKNYFIKGQAGTGKTLLAYDIAKTYLTKEKKRVLIIHCANLNTAQENKLNMSGFTIVPIKEINNYTQTDFSNYDVLIVDEFQRMHELTTVDKIFEFPGQIIISGDPKQWLNQKEDPDINPVDLDKLLKEHNISCLKLSEKIRNNEEIAFFIKHLYKLSKANQDIKKGITFNHIHVEFFQDKNKAKQFASQLIEKNWTVINLTPGYNQEEYYKDFEEISEYSSHDVIGQEFDKVATFIGSNFKYNQQTGDLTSANTYYPSVKTLFENLTRTKEELYLIIIDNIEVFRQCIKIINSPEK